MKEKIQHSKKAREKLADSLMQISNILSAGLLGTVLIAPMATLFKALGEPDDSVASVWAAINDIPPFESMAFVSIYLIAIYLVFVSRSDAMRIYTEIHPDES